MQYINQYTDEIIRRGRAPKPPPPLRDQYQMFGNAFNTEESIIRPLESQVSDFCKNILNRNIIVGTTQFRKKIKNCCFISFYMFSIF